MSIKGQQFARIITNPMNTHKFEVSIPDIAYTSVVESTTFPSQGEFRTIELWAQGERVKYFGLPDNGGEWTIHLPESDSAIIKKTFDDKFMKSYNQKTGLLTPHVWDNIVVTCLSLAGDAVFSVTLHGCWVKKRSDLQLDASKPENAAKWDYVFVYNWLEDNEVNHVEPSPSPM